MEYHTIKLHTGILYSFWKYADLWPYKTYGGKPHTAMYGRGTKEGLQDLGDALRRKRLRSVSSSSEMKGARQSAIAADRRTGKTQSGTRGTSRSCRAKLGHEITRGRLTSTKKCPSVPSMDSSRSGVVACDYDPKGGEGGEENVAVLEEQRVAEAAAATAMACARAKAPAPPLPNPLHQCVAAHSANASTPGGHSTTQRGSTAATTVARQPPHLRPE